MKVGTRSLLYGVHQVFLHPIFVLVAWVWLFGRPSFEELVAIIIHDWGYWGKADMDGPEGDTHPEWAGRYFDRRGRKDLGDLCRSHSRFWAKKHGLPLSKLTYADKLGSAIMPVCLWLFLARITGEYTHYIDAPKHEVNREGIGNDDPAGWFRQYRYLTCQIIGEDLYKYRRDA